MATGKELVRLVTCGYWDELIRSRKDFKAYAIYDKDGKRINHQQANEKTFCSIRIMFKDCPKKEFKLLCVIMKMIADTSSESMYLDVSKTLKGYQEVVIS